MRVDRARVWLGRLGLCGGWVRAGLSACPRARTVIIWRSLGVTRPPGGLLARGPGRGFPPCPGYARRDTDPDTANPRLSRTSRLPTPDGTPSKHRYSAEAEEPGRSAACPCDPATEPYRSICAARMHR